MFVEFIQFLNRFPKTILLVVACLSLFFFFQAKSGLIDNKGQLKIDSSIEPFIERNSGAYQDFLQARKDFGSEEIILVALHQPTEKSIGLHELNTLSLMKNEIQATIPNISSVLTLMDVPQAMGACQGKSFFHEVGIASVCVSILEKFKQNFQCIQNPKQVVVHQNETADFENKLEEYLEGSLEDDLDDGIEEDLSVTPEGEKINSHNALTSENCSEDILPLNEHQLKKETEQKIKTILQKIAIHPMFKGGLISEDLSTLGLIISYKKDAQASAPENQKLLANIFTKYKHESVTNPVIAYAGQSRQIYQAAEMIRADFQKVLPYSILLIILILFIAFRSWQPVVIPLLVVILGTIWTAAAVAFNGDQLNLVTIACAPIIICVGSAYVIKMLTQYQLVVQNLNNSQKSENNLTVVKQAVSRTLFSVSIPVSVTALTTVAGFAALMVSPIPAIQQLGFYSSLGILAINVFTLTLAPALLHYLHIPELKPNRLNSNLLSNFLTRVVEVIKIYSKKLIWIWIILAGITGSGMFMLEIDSSTRNFPEDNPVVQDLKLIEQYLGGTDTLRILLQKSPNSNSQQALISADTMYGLKKFNDWIFQKNGVNEISKLKGIEINEIQSPVDYLEHFRLGLYRLTDSEVHRFYNQMNVTGPKFLNDSKTTMQLTLRIRSDGSSSILELKELLDQKIPVLLPHLQVQYTGSVILASESANNISEGQVQSVFFALLIVFFILSALFLSWKMGIIALFPNVIAIVIFFGTLGWLNIPIGVTISVIAAIALGVGVDDTIHFLNHYNETAKKLRDKRRASLETLPQVARPMLFSTIALSSGFILFTLSEMESQVMFGTLTAFTLLVCLATDMTFLPSVVMETGLITVWDYAGLKFDDEFIKKIDVFQDMNVREAKIATLVAYTVDFEKDEILFSQGDLGDELYVVLSGSISIFLTENETVTPLVVLEKGRSFGEMGLFRETERSAGAKAVESTRLLVLNDDGLDDLKSKYPKIAAKLFFNLAVRLKELLKGTMSRMDENQINTLSSHPSFKKRLPEISELKKIVQTNPAKVADQAEKLVCELSEKLAVLDKLLQKK